MFLIAYVNLKRKLLIRNNKKKKNWKINGKTYINIHLLYVCVKNNNKYRSLHKQFTTTLNMTVVSIFCARIL